MCYISFVSQLYLQQYAWVRYLLNDKGKRTIKTFKNAMKSNKKAENLQAEKGSEFYNKSMEKFIDKNKIKMQCIENEKKSLIVE